jgi:hypothetical protein
MDADALMIRRQGAGPLSRSAYGCLRPLSGLLPAGDMGLGKAVQPVVPLGRLWQSVDLSAGLAKFRVIPDEGAGGRGYRQFRSMCAGNSMPVLKERGR